MRNCKLSHLKHLSGLCAILFTILFNPNSALAADPIYTSFFSSSAVGGYDVVSYFDGGEPVKGSKKFKTQYKGATWYFANEKNLNTFKASPTQFEPQYGGYCAYAAALGETAKGDPLQYHLEDGKLYLNIDKDIKTKWLKDKGNYIQKADKNWPALLSQ